MVTKELLQNPVLSSPETTEEPHFEKTSFRIGKKTFLDTLKNPINSAYFYSKNWEKKGKTYELIGINLYRKLLVLIGWKKLNKKTKPVGKNLAALINLHYTTRQDVLAHLIILIIVAGFTLVVIYEFGFLRSLWLIIFNILLNLYPVFLQRCNRPRIEKVLHIKRNRVGQQDGPVASCSDYYPEMLYNCGKMLRFDCAVIRLYDFR